MNERTKRLHQLMTKHEMNAAQVGAMLDRAKATVDMWRVGTPRTIPSGMLALLEMKLDHGNRKAA